MHTVQLTTSVIWLSVVMGILSGCQKQPDLVVHGCDNTALNGLALAQAKSLLATTSALSAISQHDVPIATDTLQAELTSGLTLLYTLGENSKGQEARLISEAITVAEDYAKIHGLKPARPSSGTLSTDQNR